MCHVVWQWLVPKAGCDWPSHSLSIRPRVATQVFYYYVMPVQFKFCCGQFTIT